MKKSLSFALLFSFLTLGSLSIASCNNGASTVIPEEKTISSISIKANTIPNEILIGHFDDCGIKLVINYSDGTTEEISVTESLVAEQYRDFLRTPGTYSIVIVYEGKETRLTIKMVDVQYNVNFYAYVDSNEYTLLDSQNITIHSGATAPEINIDVYYEGKHYTFKKWDIAFDDVTSQLDVYATYDSVNYYIVKFFNGNNELINSQNIDEGNDATEPNQQSMAMEGYTFIGWDRNFTNITKSINVYGLYVSTSKSDLDDITLTLNKKELLLDIDETKILIATTNKQDATLQWFSSNEKVVTVDNNGLVTAVRAGTANIAVRIKNTNKISVCKVIVSESIEEAKTIKMWAPFNADYQAIIEKAIEKYEETYPGYKVIYTKYSGSYNDLANACVNGFSSNHYPDMAVVYPERVSDFLMAGRALNIKPYMTNSSYGWTQQDLADIPSGYLEESENYFVDGAYSLPLCQSTEAMYYNRNIIGVDLSMYDKTINNGQPLTDAYIQNLTWEEFFDHLAPALIDCVEEQYIELIDITGSFRDQWAILGHDSDDNFFITLAEQYGYGYTSVNKATGVGSVDFVNDGMKGLMKKLNSAYKNRYITTHGAISTYCNYLFTTEQMLFSIGSTGGFQYQFSNSTHYDVGVAPIPHAAGKDYKVVNQGPSLAFLKSATDVEAHAEQCWKFYKILSSTEINTEWSLTTGYAPIRLSVTNTNAYLDFANENKFDLHTIERLTARNAKYVGSILDHLYSVPVFYGSSKVRTAVKDLLPACLRSTNIDAEIDQLFQQAYNNAI